MAILAYVDGQEGTTGLRIHEYLAQRDDIEVLRIADHQRKDPAERARLLNAADVSFLCLPDGAARDAAALVTNPKTCVIDASSAHRTASEWVYGLPELVASQRGAIRGAKRISNPGCHATAFILLLRPLVDAGVVPSVAAVSATSITGYSGGGKKMIEQYQAGGDTRLDAPRPYALSLAHKHVPEMAVHARLGVAPMFMPIVGNFYKGLAVSVPLHRTQLAAGSSPESVHEVLRRHYEGERYVRVRPLRDEQALHDAYFDVQGCNDTNRVDIFVFADATNVLLVARLDNLGKGASGAAVQSMNVHFGLDEAKGLGS
ncbi:MAG: N-acetyl-gamma-glutamyl-phosphate reductase [Pseudomonadota bacterium]|nr:N-acetyl-gamma-glutamyl-phosphate reductase [Pseudomonadota bacterium]